MFKTLMFTAALALPLAAIAEDQATESSSRGGVSATSPRVVLHTNHGNIVLELDRRSAPVSVDNFIRYVRSGHYANTIFHRVIDGFMIQGGGYTPELGGKANRPPILNEAPNGLKNKRGTIAMARTNDPHSASSQFFINLVDNTALDHVATTDSRSWGYAVFGKVVEGMDVVDTIKALPVRSQGVFEALPVEPVIVEKAELVGADDESADSE